MAIGACPSEDVGTASSNRIPAAEINVGDRAANFKGGDHQPAVESGAACLARQIEVSRMNDADILRLDGLGHRRRTLDEAYGHEKRSERDSERLEHVASPFSWGR